MIAVRSPLSSPSPGDVIVHRTGATIRVEAVEHEPWGDVRAVRGRTEGGSREPGPFTASAGMWTAWMKGARTGEGREG